MAGITYKITGKRFGANFNFDLIIEDDSRSLLGTRGRWRISNPSGLGTLAPLLYQGGTWEYRSFIFPPEREGYPAREGYLFLHTEGREMSPFDIALDKVPDDYIHGPFCSVASGKGTLSASVQEDIIIQWEVTGPGCV